MLVGEIHSRANGISRGGDLHIWFDESGNTKSLLPHLTKQHQSDNNVSRKIKDTRTQTKTLHNIKKALKQWHKMKHWHNGISIHELFYKSTDVLPCGNDFNKSNTLRWRHNGQDGVSNHQPHHCLLNSLFGCRSKKTSKLRVPGLCAGNSPGTGEFSAQMASNVENVSIRWRHHEQIQTSSISRVLIPKYFMNNLVCL